jgi:5-methylcytosine-specific restriction enzyme A
MANAPLHQCQRCRKLVRGKCPTCSNKPYTRQRDTRLPSSQRGYDGAWRKVRDQKLAQDLLCQDCEERGITESANEAHHVLKVADHPDRRLDIDNLRSLCGRCHKRRTRRGE